MDVEDANSTNTIRSFAFRKIFHPLLFVGDVFIRDKATIFRAPPALRTPLRDIIIYYYFFASVSLIRLFCKKKKKKKKKKKRVSSGIY